MNTAITTAERPATGGELLKRGLSCLHESLADYMLINPGCTLREMGAYFNYTPAWICTVINTDMFKAYLAARRKDIEVAVAQDLPSKLQAAGHLATERLIEVIGKTEDPEIIVDTFDKVLHRLGYAPNSKSASAGSTVNNTQNNVFYLNKEDMKQIKSDFVAAHNNAPLRELPPVIEAESVKNDSG